MFFRSVGDLPGEAKANGNLCSVFKMLGDYDKAILCSQQQLEIARNLPVPNKVRIMNVVL